MQVALPMETRSSLFTHVPLPGLRSFIPVLLGLAILVSGAANAETRLALVIGNAAYTHVDRLQNSVEDARAMRRALTATGFEVIYREDADRRTMNRAVDEFVGRLSTDTVALVYYAGHGVQIGAANYLLPTDIDPDTADDVATDGMDLSRMLERVTATQARFSLAIIDACRDNPFRVADRSLKLARGLVSGTSADGMMVVYSAGANQTALDRLSDKDTNPNGVFTREWLRTMSVPGLSVQEVAVRVRQSVAALARSVGHLQTPAVYDESLGTFEFVPGSAAPPVAPAAPAIPASVVPPPVPATAPSAAPADTAPTKSSGPAPVQKCDRLAQPARADMGKVPAFADGVKMAVLDPFGARDACAQAMAEWPNEVRFVAYAGRAAGRMGDVPEALRLYRLAADRGSAVGQDGLAAMYAIGAGVVEDQTEAARLYRLAADQGYPLAMTSLGTDYSFGRGVARDEREAVRLWTLVVESSGEDEAETNLGVMYAQGRGGLRKDMHEAARLWRLAAAQHDQTALKNLRAIGAAAQPGPEH